MVEPVRQTGFDVNRPTLISNLIHYYKWVEISRIYNMAEYPAMPAKRRFEASGFKNRRRITDMPQPLDYVTLELVSNIIENQQPVSTPQKSFFQRLLKSE